VRGPQVILASASPRRRELMRLLGVPFEVLASAVEEDLPAESARPSSLAIRLAHAKAAAVARARPGSIVIGADTIVVLGKRLFGKPADDEDARAMLRALSGRSHRVITGLAVIDTRVRPGGCSSSSSSSSSSSRTRRSASPAGIGGSSRTTTRTTIEGSALPAPLTAAETTRVDFRELDPAEIDAYVATGEPFGKAGAYAIQGQAALFATGIRGDYANVVGLPVARLASMLRARGVSILGIGPVHAP